MSACGTSKPFERIERTAGFRPQAVMQIGPLPGDQPSSNLGPRDDATPTLVARKTAFWEICGSPEFVNTCEIWNQVVSRGMNLISSLGGSDVADFCFFAVAMPLFLTCDRTRAKKRNGKLDCTPLVRHEIE